MEILITSLLLDFFYFILIFSCVWVFACMSMHRERTLEMKSWKWSYRWFSATMWVLGNKPWAWDSNPGLRCNSSQTPTPWHGAGWKAVKCTKQETDCWAVGHYSDLLVMRTHGPALGYLSEMGRPTGKPGAAHPGLQWEKVVHLVPCNTSQKAAIRVSRGEV